ncbi:MAG: helix-turn-helix domain-containing protein [Deltaproteobacteria bacterium]|nr:helix-turn-helix domain-containing protein [Deltaproteobacteria bacterium]
MGSEIMTIDEVTEYLHLHRTTIYGLLKRRELSGFRASWCWPLEIHRDEIHRWRKDAERKTREQAEQQVGALQQSVVADKL